MKLDDYAPPESPSVDQQRDALKKGLGRAVQWSRKGCLDEELLLTACLEDQRYDMQVADCRGDWLWSMMKNIGAVERFRAPILDALNVLGDENNAVQLCQLARIYAQYGDNVIRERLYEIVETKPIADSPWLGEEEILTLDDELGFLFAAGVRGKAMANRPWEWDDAQLVDESIERFGAAEVERLFRETDDDATRRFASAWRRDVHSREEKHPVPSHKERMRSIPAAEIIRQAESESKSMGWFRGWGINADADELRFVFDRILEKSDSAAIADLMCVFSNRAIPKFDARFLRYCRHNDAEIRRRARLALTKTSHSLIRKFALAELSDGRTDAATVRMFTSNFKPGDEQRILDAFTLPDEEYELHGLLMDINSVLEANPDADASQLGQLVFALTPCENCRFFAIRLLADQQAAPEWMRMECQTDSGADCRAFFTTRSDDAV